MPGAICARLTSETPTCSVNYSGEIGYGLIEVVIHDGRVDNLRRFGDLFLTQRYPSNDVILGVSPGAKTLNLSLDRRWNKHHANDVIRTSADLTGALEIDLEHEILVIVRTWHRGAVVLVENLRPLEKSALGDVLFKSWAVDKGVRKFVFAWSALSRGPRPRKPEAIVGIDEPMNNRAFTGPAGSGQNENQGTSAIWRLNLWTLDGLEQRLTLLGPEPLKTTGLRDADLFHQTASLDLAGARQCFKNR